MTKILSDTAVALTSVVTSKVQYSVACTTVTKSLTGVWSCCCHN